MSEKNPSKLKKIKIRHKRSFSDPHNLVLTPKSKIKPNASKSILKNTNSAKKIHSRHLSANNFNLKQIMDSYRNRNQKPKAMKLSLDYSKFKKKPNYMDFFKMSNSISEHRILGKHAKDDQTYEYDTDNNFGDVLEGSGISGNKFQKSNRSFIGKFNSSRKNVSNCLSHSCDVSGRKSRDLKDMSLPKLKNQHVKNVIGKYPQLKFPKVHYTSRTTKKEKEKSGFSTKSWKSHKKTLSLNPTSFKKRLNDSNHHHIKEKKIKFTLPDACDDNFRLRNAHIEKLTQ